VVPVPLYLPYSYDLNTVQTQRKYALGLRVDVQGINQTVGGESTVMGGGGLMFRYRHSPHWGLEAAIDRLDGSFSNSRFERTSTPATLSLMCHLTPRGAFDLHLIGGIGYVASDVRIDNPPGHPDLAVGKQSFGEFQAHLGVGAELRLGRMLGITADVRYIGRTLLDSQDGKYYKGVSDGPIPSSSQGYAVSFGALLHF
jgi:hypothetical protein